MQRWVEISDFPGYSVSDDGRVRNDYTGRILALLRNQRGHTHVGMTKNGVQYKRSVARLVAKIFLRRNTLPYFNTPLHLDDDRSNNHYSNLVWRPKWFVDKYTKQFERGRPLIGRPIRDIETGERFNHSWEACMKYGLLEYDILKSIDHGIPVKPTYQTFEYSE
jgi:hypothetical protein